MRIKHVHVFRYGPLPAFQRALGGFTLVHGPNERGKTLLLDAIFRLLFKRDLKRTAWRIGGPFGNLGRVEESPEGYLVLDVAGRERKLGPKDTLASTTQLDITPDDFRNVFLVRDSDATLNEATSYFNSVSARLTGMRTGEIDRLMRGVQKHALMRSATVDSKFSNRAEDEKLSDRIDGTTALIEEIETTMAQLVRDDFDETALELARATHKADRLQRELARFEDVRLRERYRRALDALDAWQSHQQHLAAHQPVEAQLVRDWQRGVVQSDHLQARLRTEQDQRNRAASDVGRLRSQVEKVRQLIEPTEAHFAELKSRLGPLMERYQFFRAEHMRTRSGSKLIKWFMFGFLVLALVAVAGYLTTPSTTIAIVAGGFATVSLALGAALIRVGRSAARVEALRDQLTQLGRSVNLGAESVNDFQSALEDVSGDLEAQRAELKTLETRLAVEDGELKRADERLQQLRADVAEGEARLAEFVATSGAKTLPELQARAEQQRRHDHAAREKLSAARTLLGDSFDPAQHVEWRDRIAGEVATLDASIPESVSAKDAQKLETELAHTNKLVEKLTTQLESGRRRLHALEVRAGELRVLDEVPRVRSVVELRRLRQDLLAFCQARSDQLIAGQRAVGILQSLRDEEASHVEEMFGANAYVSQLFREFTGGRYTAVTYDIENEQINVRLKDGGDVAVEALSGGAFDQLHLAVRIALGQRLCGDEPGFFLMDDPFIKADSGRLQHLLDCVKRLVAEGWQVVYFSAKDEVADALGKDIASGAVTYIPMGQEAKSLVVPQKAKIEPPRTAGQHSLFE